MKSSDLFVFVSQATGLHFRHTDNVIQWLNAMSEKGLPKVSVAHPLRYEMGNNVEHSSSCDEKHKTQSLRHSESFKWKKSCSGLKCLHISNFINQRRDTEVPRKVLIL